MGSSHGKLYFRAQQTVDPLTKKYTVVTNFVKQASRISIAYAKAHLLTVYLRERKKAKTNANKSLITQWFWLNQIMTSELQLTALVLMLLFAITQFSGALSQIAIRGHCSESYWQGLNCMNGERSFVMIGIISVSKFSQPQL